MNNSTFNDFRDSGDLVVDYPSRKIAVYANASGHVVLMCQEDGVCMHQLVTPEEIDQLCAALKRAGKEAQPIADSMQAGYEAFVAISKAQGFAV